MQTERVVIRLGQAADYPAIAAIYRRASLSNPGDRDQLLAHPEHLVLAPLALAEGRTHVAEEGDSVIGFATWVETKDRVELEDLFVDPDRMRRGVATALLNRIVEVVRARSSSRLEVVANPHALGFYRAKGFIDLGPADTMFGVAPQMALEL